VLVTLLRMHNSERRRHRCVFDRVDADQRAVLVAGLAASASVKLKAEPNPILRARLCIQYFQQLRLRGFAAHPNFKTEPRLTLTPQAC
jgi:hypothetical protein